MRYPRFAKHQTTITYTRGIVFCTGLDKSLAASNWEQAVLSPAQITYAALDALVAVLITIKMAETDTVRSFCVYVSKLVFVLQQA